MNNRIIELVILRQGIEDYGQFYEILWELNEKFGKLQVENSRGRLEQIIIRQLINEYLEVVELDPLNYKILAHLEIDTYCKISSDELWKVPDKYAESKIRFMTTDKGKMHLLEIEDKS